MAKRAAKANTERSKAIIEARAGQRNPDARTYERPIVPIEQIDEASNALRADHPQVTDEQARFVHLLIQTGKPIKQLCKLSGTSENWAYYHMSKSHVADYRQAVSIRTLGWASSAALSTMSRLLTAKSDYIKLEAARDLLDRGGMTLDPVKPVGSGAVFNFNLTPMAIPPVSEPLVVEGVVLDMSAEPDQSARPATSMAQGNGMGPVALEPEEGGGLQNQPLAGGQGEPHTRLGSDRHIEPRTRPGSEGFVIRSSSPPPL